MGKAPKGSSIDEVPGPDYEVVGRLFLEEFGTDKAGEIALKLRRGLWGSPS